MMRTRRNPEAGTHLDLFEPGPTKMFVPLSSLEREQIVALPRSAFSNSEWTDLDEDDQEAIYEGDAESAELIEAFVKEFKQRVKWAANPELDYSNVESYFEEFLRGRADELIQIADRAGYDATELVAEYVANGYTEETVEEKLNEVLADSNNYEFQYDTDEYGKAFFKDRVTESVYIDRGEVAELIEKSSGYRITKTSSRRAMFRDEIERAIDQVNQYADREFSINFHLDIDDVIDKNGKAKYVEMDDVATFWVDADPKWDKVEESLAEAMSEKDPLGPLKGEPPPAERVLYRWPDGFYVQDLTPQELGAEGKSMSMCVGRPDMGYGKAVRDKEIKILSLRRPSGKPLFTFEADLDRKGEISGCEQIAGKANREPGFDLGKEGPDAPIKKDEVERVIDFVIHLGLDPAECVSRERHPSLGPALNWIIAHQGDDLWARKMVEKVKAASGHAAAYFAQTNPSRRRNPPVCAVGHEAGCTGFCLPYRSRR